MKMFFKFIIIVSAVTFQK